MSISGVVLLTLLAAAMTIQTPPKAMENLVDVNLDTDVQEVTVSPEKPPTKSPAALPTPPSTAQPTKTPTKPPTAPPTAQPTKPPTAPPTAQPTKPPTAPPTAQPTKPPTAPPTAQPTKPPITPPTLPPTVPPTFPPTTLPTPVKKCDRKYSCADCKTAQICQPTVAGGYTFLSKVSCPRSFPYCDYSTGTCTNVPDEKRCGVETTKFHCLKDGHFPDLKNSKLYYLCKNLVAFKFVCSFSGEVYDALETKCVKSEEFAPFTCDHAGEKTPYSKGPQYFGYCDKANAAPYTVDKCPGEYQLNITSQVCEPICNEEGFIPDVDDCTKYYKCEMFWIDENTKTLVKEEKDCPPNTSFSITANMCVEGKSNPDCPTKSAHLS